MSTNKLGQKLFSFILWIFFVSLLISLFKQIAVYRRVDRRLLDEQRQLEVLEERNRQLKERLKEISRSEPAFSKTEETLGLESVKNQPIFLPKKNYKKWIELFFYWPSTTGFPCSAIPLNWKSGTGLNQLSFQPYETSKKSTVLAPSLIASSINNRLV